jgi:hypothetical protein
MPIFWIDSLRIRQDLSNVLGIATRIIADRYIQREVFRKRPYRFPGVFTSAIRLASFHPARYQGWALVGIWAVSAQRNIPRIRPTSSSPSWEKPKPKRSTPHVPSVETRLSLRTESSQTERYACKRFAFSQMDTIGIQKTFQGKAVTRMDQGGKAKLNSGARAA